MSADISKGAGQLSAKLPVIVRPVDQARIDRYAAASHDFNPIHVDPEFSKTGPFGRPIGHGLMTLAFVSQMLNEWSDGAFDACGEIDITFIAPVFAGDVVEVTGEIEGKVERDGEDCLRVKLLVSAGGRQILAGYAIQPVGA
ncbi:MaoC family dehydratase [Tianweitania sediminis]|uniref:MaoC family dehydratase n=1 Tax=Tianweitania sediminis TaxID=1502156 RepID=A0A8J7UMH5_9HYPH|nr:MaoC family dehydratase [Tianweitania sediminis]MBP0440362.1 MaoC family dehydratase [Tianweitania sediminis]